MIKKFATFIVLCAMCFGMVSCAEKDPYTVRTDLEDGSWLIHEYISEDDMRPEKITKYYPAGNIDYEIIYEYTKDGKPLSIVQLKADGGEDLRTDYEYDSNGMLLKTTYYKYGFVRSVDEHNPDGTTGTSTSYDRFGNVTGRSEYTYDENSEVISFVSYDKDGRIESEAKYSDEGLVMYHYLYDADGTLIETYVNGELLKK